MGRVCTWLASLAAAPYYGRVRLAKINPKGYVSNKATIHHCLTSLGQNIFIDDDVLIYQDYGGGPVKIGDGVHLHRQTIIQTGQDGSIVLGAHAHIQPRCQFSAYKASIVIGREVEIAPYCAFYSYNHTIDPCKSIREQPLQSKGDIIIEDDVWLSVGAIVLDGVRIGKGAVIGAGAVVTKSIPKNCVAVGNPARVLKMRGSS